MRSMTSSPASGAAAQVEHWCRAWSRALLQGAGSGRQEHQAPPPRPGAASPAQCTSGRACRKSSATSGGRPRAASWRASARWTGPRRPEHRSWWSCQMGCMGRMGRVGRWGDPRSSQPRRRRMVRVSCPGTTSRLCCAAGGRTVEHHAHRRTCGFCFEGAPPASTRGSVRVGEQPPQGSIELTLRRNSRPRTRPRRPRRTDSDRRQGRWGRRPERSSPWRTTPCWSTRLASPPAPSAERWINHGWSTACATEGECGAGRTPPTACAHTHTPHREFIHMLIHYVMRNPPRP